MTPIKIVVEDQTAIFEGAEASSGISKAPARHYWSHNDSDSAVLHTLDAAAKREGLAALSKRGRGPLPAEVAPLGRLELDVSAELEEALNGLADSAGVSRNSVVEQLVLESWRAVRAIAVSKYGHASTVALADMRVWFNIDSKTFAAMSKMDYVREFTKQTNMLGEIIGRGIPFDKDEANALGGHYLGSLDDGSIVSRGAELKFGPGRFGSELWVLRPDSSKVRFEVTHSEDEWTTGSINQD